MSYLKQGEAHAVEGGGEGAGEDEGLDALLQARDVHDLQKVALHRAQQARVQHALVLGMLALQGPGATSGQSHGQPRRNRMRPTQHQKSHLICITKLESWHGSPVHDYIELCLVSGQLKVSR